MTKTEFKPIFTIVENSFKSFWDGAKHKKDIFEDWYEDFERYRVDQVEKAVKEFFRTLAHAHQNPTLAKPVILNILHRHMEEDSRRNAEPSKQMSNVGWFVGIFAKPQGGKMIMDLQDKIENGDAVRGQGEFSTFAESLHEAYRKHVYEPAMKDEQTRD